MSEFEGSKSEVAEAIASVEMIRQLVEKMPAKSTLRSEALITSLLLSTALLFLGVELFWDGMITKDFLTTVNNQDLRITGLASLAIATSLLLVGIYSLAWCRARELNATLSRTLKRSFPVLRFGQFVPDLLLKFAILTLIVVIRRPDLVALILVAFSADFTLQGRFFRLPERVRILLGIALFGLAGIMFLQGWASLAIPLVAFSSVSIVSLSITLYWLRERNPREQ